MPHKIRSLGRLDHTSCLSTGLSFLFRVTLLIYTKLGSIIGGGLDAPEIRNGFGRHQYYLNDHQIQEFKKYTYGEWLQTFFTLMVTKVSICLLLLRISPNKRIIRPIQSLVVFLVLSNVVLSLAWILQCIPVDGAWDATKQKTAKCLTQGQVQRVIISQASRFFGHVLLIYRD